MMHLGTENSSLGILGLSCSLSSCCILQVSSLGENLASIIYALYVSFTSQILY